jgi:putative nucleotidyltransferase with HDIG domain
MRVRRLRDLRKNLGVVGVLVVSFCLLIWLVAKPFFGTRYSYSIGDVSQEDIVSPRDITYVNMHETQKRIEEVKRRVPAIFDFTTSPGEETARSLRRFFAALDALDGNGAPFDEKKETLFERGLLEKGAAGLSDANFRDLFVNYKSRRYRERLESVAKLILNSGLSALPRGELLKYSENGVLLKKIQETEIVQEKVGADEIIALDEVQGTVESYLRTNARDLTADNIRTLSALASLFLKPNLSYQGDETISQINEEVGKVKPVLNTIKKRAIVIRRGEEINEDNYPKLKAIIEYTSTFNVRAVAGMGVLILLILYLVSFPFRDEYSTLDVRSYLVLVGFVLFTVAYSFLIAMIKQLPSALVFAVLVPVSGVTMTAELLYRRRSSLALALVLPVFILLISGNDAYSFLFSLGSGLVAVYAVREAERRSEILKASLTIGGADILILAAIGLLRGLSGRDFITLVLWGAGNAIVSVVIAMGIIPFFEIVLNVPTNFRLLELADLNTPIMKKIQIEAPGTYYHSINVANMAESAARSVRANPLLARVAALYHDIGKIPNAEYFVENNQGVSKHEAIKPSLSNTVLKAHVKIGVEMAREMKLPKEVVQIIAQHHGTSLIKFFYHQALKKRTDGDEVDKKEFHYQGPKPQTLEAAIVMLADAVEAASRTLKNPSAKRIEDFVSEIIEGRFREGQLSESPLTLRGLMKISIAFRRYLTGVFHTRIDYPDDREIESARQEKF